MEGGGGGEEGEGGRGGGGRGRGEKMHNCYKHMQGLGLILGTLGLQKTVLKKYATLKETKTEI